MEVEMKKKLVIAALALIVVLAIVVPAMAQSTPTPAPAKSFTALGPVQSVIRSAGALRLHVNVGSQAVKPFIGGSLAVRVAPHARILMVRDGIAHLIPLANVHAGEQVVVRGSVNRSQPGSPVYIAQNIKVVVRTPANQLTSFACGGPAKAVDAVGTPNTLTLTVNAASRALWGRLGQHLATVVTPQTQILLKSGATTTTITLSQVVVGEKAWMSGTIDRSQTTPVFTADKVTVQALPTPTTSVTPGG